jgi:hypothetical protein
MRIHHPKSVAISAILSVLVGSIVPCLSQVPDPTFPLGITNGIGVSCVVGSNGVYSVVFLSPAWTFAGNLAQGLTGRAVNSGTDAIGAYSEITFNYTSAVPHSAGIRLYNNSPVVTFDDTTLAAGTNDLAFPRWVNYPTNLSHISFGENAFSTYSFNNLHGDSPWLFFQTNHDAFVTSAATNYLVASARSSGGAISYGINSSITQLPSGFSHRIILVAQNGINKIYSTWGNALLALTGKTPPANDAVVELNKLGYWTDNGASYYPYYNGTAPGIANTLLAVKDEYANKGVPISYMQLDSWWYKKGPSQVWNDPNNGFSLYEPDPYLFTNGLAAFQQELGLPLLLHNRWVYNNSPYITVSNYTASGIGTQQGVIIDPRFWTNIMDYITSIGGVTYEQDWLNFRGEASMNLNDPFAYLNNMAAAAAARGINLQYCMVQAPDYLQGTCYTNLMTIRTSQDDFTNIRWTEFLYGSRLAQAVGIWPWSDVYMSPETRNLLVSTLSAGPVGLGDALTTVNATNLLKSVRPDGIIVKPDVPLVPADETYVNDALGLGQPFIATTYTEHDGSRALYVFAYGENAGKLTNSFRPADFGITNNAYVYDYFAATGTVVNAGGAFSFTTTMPDDFNGGNYFVAAPLGPSGLALIGDTGKFVMLGKKRISQLTDNGTLSATIVFAPGESFVNLVGYSPTYPATVVSQGSGGLASYDLTTHLFTANVIPDGTGTAVIQFSSGGYPPSAPATPTGLTAAAQPDGQIKLSWLASSGANGYNLKRSQFSGGPYAIVSSGSLQTNYTDSGLSPDTTYYYVVSALNGGTESDHSLEASTTTSNAPSPIAVTYEAENATLSGPVIANAYPGFSGTGYADYQNNSNDYIEWTINTALASTCPLTWRYANGGAGNRPLRVSVNGVAIATNNFPATGGWANWAFAATNQVTLNAGNNSVRLTAIGSSGGNVDYLLAMIAGTNSPPTLAAISNRTIGVGQALTIVNTATDANLPAQTLAFGLLSAPPNAAIYANSGVLTWRPSVAQADTTNLFKVIVTDSGSPSMSATQSFAVAVSPLARPQLSASLVSSGRVALRVSGVSGPDYEIQSSTNLVDWSAVFKTYSPAVPFVWTNSNTALPMSFFRVLVGPPF